MIRIMNRSSMTIGLPAGKGALQLLIEFIVRKTAGPFLDNDVYINGRPLGGDMQAKVLPDPSFDTITTNGVADFATYGDTQTRPRRQAGSDNKHQVCRMVFASFLP